MMKTGILMIGCATILTISGCAADSPADGADPSQATAELVTLPDVTTNGFGTFGPIRLANTSLCVQPIAGSTGNVLVELHGCNGTQAQNWLLASTAKGHEIINQQSSKCLYDGAPLPLFDGGKPITHEDCTLSGTSNVVSNALWKPTTSGGNTTLMSRLQFRDTGFCLDVPGGNAFEGAQLQMWHCNGTAAQQWVVN